MYAAVAKVSAEPAPDVMYAAGTPANLAISSPATFSSSISGMKALSARSMASLTSCTGVEPPSRVTLPVALMTG